MDNVVKSLRILQVAMLLCIVLYVGILVRLAPQVSESPRRVFLIAIMFLSVLNVAGVLLIRRLFCSSDHIGARMR
jgi:hypothetical protein